MKKSITKSIGIGFITLIGSFMVFSWVVIMNNFVTSPDRIKKVSSISFVVPQTEKKEKTPPKPKREKKARKSNAVDLAPLPNLGESFSGIALDLPNFVGEGAVNSSLLGDLENVSMTENSVDTAPIPKNLKVNYPERAKQRNLEGSVLVSVQVSDKGKVSQIEILESSPPGVFDEAVKEASKSWTFTPGKYQGLPISTWVNIPIPFKLN